MDETTSGTSPFPGHGELTRRQADLLDELVELFLSRGFRHLSLDDLAAALHCSKATLYALAPSKEQLAARCVEYYFRRAAVRVEKRVAGQGDAAGRLREYLLGVSDELAAASARFIGDIARHPVAHESYERHTRIAANRVRALVADGVASGDFDDVHAVFVGEVTAAAMDAIERGGITSRTGLTHAEAYGELASVVLGAVGAGRRRRGAAGRPGT